MIVIDTRQLWQGLYLISLRYNLTRDVNIDSVSVNQFRDNLKACIEQSVNAHTPLKVTRRAGEAFVVVSADDREREQETLYLLQNNSLMNQIADSVATHKQNTG